MLNERQREAERQVRFASLGVSAKDITEIADILYQMLESEGVFNKPGCNSQNIFYAAYERLGYEGALTEEAINNLCFRGLAERVGCDIPESVHIRETIEWWRLQKTPPTA